MFQELRSLIASWVTWVRCDLRWRDMKRMKRVEAAVLVSQLNLPRDYSDFAKYAEIAISSSTYKLQQKQVRKRDWGKKSARPAPG